MSSLNLQAYTRFGQSLKSVQYEEILPPSALSLSPLFPLILSSIKRTLGYGNVHNYFFHCRNFMIITIPRSVLFSVYDHAIVRFPSCLQSKLICALLCLLIGNITSLPQNIYTFSENSSSIQKASFGKEQVLILQCCVFPFDYFSVQMQHLRIHFQDSQIVLSSLVQKLNVSIIPPIWGDSPCHLA